jgi:hypothetical protein
MKQNFVSYKSITPLNMKKKFFLILSVLLITSCQKDNSKPAIVNPSLKIEKESQKPIALGNNVQENDHEIYKSLSVDSLPKYPGGINKFHVFLTKNYVIPQKAVEKEAMGGVFASFVIEKDGTLSDIKILHDFGYGSGEELLRVLKLSPNWIPAIKDGYRVRCLYSVPYYVQ